MTQKFKVIKLPRRGPKGGQSVADYMKGKDLQSKRIKRQLNREGKLTTEDLK